MIPDKILLVALSSQHVLSAAIPSIISTPLKKISYTAVGKIAYPLTTMLQTRLTSRLLAEVIAGSTSRLFSSETINVILNPSSLFCPPRIIYTILSTFGLWFLAETAQKHGNIPLYKRLRLLYDLNLLLVNVINTVACGILFAAAVMSGNVPIAIINIICIAAIWIPYLVSHTIDPKNEALKLDIRLRKY